MPKPTVRWITDPSDLPRDGEYTARLAPMPGWTVDEVVRGGGRLAPPVALLEHGRLVATGDPKPTDLHIRRSRLELTITAWDGRKLIAGFGPHAGMPQHDTDAAADLVRALAIAWRARPTIGRPKGSTSIDDPKRLGEALAEMRRDRARITKRALATRAGYTEAELRGYLNRTGQSWSDFLASN